MADPLTDEERVRFVREMSAHVAGELAAGRGFQVTSSKPEVAELMHQVTSRVAQRLERPVTGMRDGRRFTIALPEHDALGS